MLAVLLTGCGDSDGRPANDAGFTDGRSDDVDTLPTDTGQNALSEVYQDAGGLDSSIVDSASPTLAQLDAFTSTTDTGISPPPAPTDTASPLDGPAPSKATVVVLPDTQYYAAGYPDVFYSQTKWIATKKPSLNIAAVLHVGDVVDTDNAAQWTVARGAMNELDKVAVPYVLVPGNHDYHDVNRATIMDSYFGRSVMPWITGTMIPGQIENSYALVDIGPRQWLILGLEFGPRDSVMTWADSVLKTYPDRPAIILTHAYLYHDGHRYDIDVSGSDSSQPNYQYWIPQYYGFTATQGINDGERMWQKLVLPNPNVRLVFSGHDTGTARLASARPDGSVVYQMLSDFQWYRTDAPDYYGGGGYLRVLEFDYDARQIGVRTYSPYLDTYLTDDQNQFVIGLD